MPLPLIIGAAALAAASYGAKKGYDGYQKHSEADEIIKDADSKYKRKKRIMDDQENDTQVALQKLGDKKLKIGKEIGDFKKIADALIKRLAINSKNADLNKIGRAHV